MKKMILYVIMMGIAIAINSCEKEPLEPDNLAGTIGFSDSPYMIFTVSLDKTGYKVGEMATASVRINADQFDYRGAVTIAGNEYYFFDGEQLYLSHGSWFCFVSVETTPGNYNATFAITKYTYIVGIKITKTKQVQIPYEVR